MEKEKKIDLARSQGHHEFIETVFWQWQSGPGSDPWKEKDPVKWTWQDYSDDDCRIIEQTFLLKKEIANLKDYEVDLKKMVQVNKKFRDRIRRVRRQKKSRFMMETSEPVVIVKTQKTINGAFGTIQHFLDYTMKRTPEAYRLYQKLKPLTLDSKQDVFEDIMKAVVTCIEKGAEAREKIVKTRSGFQRTNFLLEAQQIIHLIRNSSAILGDFLKVILRVYTMETFICYWLNELLRSEDWEEINVLTPFLVCLVYTFKLPEFIMKYEKPQGLMKNLLGFAVKNKLCLYRGAALTKEHLELYNPKKIKYFSWNGVTSTSREKKVAENFIQFSLRKAKDLNESKVGVFFRIRKDFASPNDCEGMIDIFQNACCEYPDEQEIILAPGTVFKLKKVRFIRNDLYEINLKVAKKFENTKANIALLGTLQDQAISKDKAVIDGLPSEQSFRLLELLKGNKLIRRLEIRNSEIEDHIMEEIEDLRLTMNVNREFVKLIDNTIVIEDLTVFAPYLSVANVNNIVASNTIRFKERNPMSPLRNSGLEDITLSLSEGPLEKFKQNNQLKELCEKIASTNQIANLEVSFQKLEYSNCEWANFLQQCIRGCKGLKSLKLRVYEDFFVTRGGLEVLCDIIGSSKTLRRLYLKLSLLNEKLKFLKEALKSFAWMQSLSLDLKLSDKISDGGLNDLKSGLLSLSSLHHLSLNFERCFKISNEGLNHLKSTLLSLSSLQYLSLNFHWCYEISDEGLNHLKTGLLSLSSLHHLSLNFFCCKDISNEGLNYLKTGLLSLSSLHHLSLDFSFCDNISDEGLSHLKTGLLSLSSLHHLSLNFERCFKVSNEGLNHLKTGLLSLSSLHHLSLKFRGCENVSDEGLNHLKSALLSLSSLQYLSLNFSECNKISNEGLSHLKGGPVSLSSLQYLFLNFSKCNKISNEGRIRLENEFKSISHVSIT